MCLPFALVKIMKTTTTKKCNTEMKNPSADHLKCFARIKQMHNAMIQFQLYCHWIEHNNYNEQSVTRTTKYEQRKRKKRLQTIWWRSQFMMSIVDCAKRMEHMKVLSINERSWWEYERSQCNGHHFGVRFVYTFYWLAYFSP